MVVSQSELTLVTACNTVKINKRDEKNFCIINRIFEIDVISVLSDNRDVAANEITVNFHCEPPVEKMQYNRAQKYVKFPCFCDIKQ